MPNVTHFEICADDMAAAIDFYSKVFDWKFNKMRDSDYWVITTGTDEDPGISGGLLSRFDEWNPTVNTIHVPCLDIFARKITEAGGTVTTPKIPVPGTGYVQYCQDLEGNVFGILEYDQSAE